jgi:glycerol dehydrogenase
MADLYFSPQHYRQQEGIRKEAGIACKRCGSRPLVLGDSVVLDILRPDLEFQFAAANLSPSFIPFSGECTEEEISRVENIAGRQDLDFLVGTGGGKAIDTARMVAARCGCPLVTIPTSAATCSAASAAAVLYQQGARQATVNGKGADLVLVDMEILARAPARLLAAGMADALAKWYEGKPLYDQNPERRGPLRAALELSQQVKETILELGLQAKRDVEDKKNSSAVEAIVEANILLTALISGLGGAKFRVSVAHALYYGLTGLPQAHQILHGEWIAWGIIVQLCLEKKEEDLNLLLPFFSRLDLPLNREKLGLGNEEDPLLWEGFRRCCAPGSSVHHMPFPVDERKLYRAILEADERANALAG